jgi:hypothetical protein
MSFPKKGKVFPKMGKDFPGGNEGDRYPEVIAAALWRDVGGTHRAIKTVARWTDASERTVKNWLAGTSGPRGEHLIDLARHSDAVLEGVLLLAGRSQSVAAGKPADKRDTVLEVIARLQTLLD